METDGGSDGSDLLSLQIVSHNGLTCFFSQKTACTYGSCNNPKFQEAIEEYMKACALRNIGRQLSFDLPGPSGADALDVDDEETTQDFETFKKWLSEMEQQEHEVPASSSSAPPSTSVVPIRVEVCGGCKKPKNKCT